MEMILVQSMDKRIERAFVREEGFLKLSLRDLPVTVGVLINKNRFTGIGKKVAVLYEGKGGEDEMLQLVSSFAPNIHAMIVAQKDHAPTLPEAKENVTVTHSETPQNTILQEECDLIVLTLPRNQDPMKHLIVTQSPVSVFVLFPAQQVFNHHDEEHHDDQLLIN